MRLSEWGVGVKMSIKFTNEPPAGIKAGLKRTYQNITQDLLDISNMAAWKPMLYCVSYLHTVVQVTILDAVSRIWRDLDLHNNNNNNNLTVTLLHCAQVQ